MFRFKTTVWLFKSDKTPLRNLMTWEGCITVQTFCALHEISDMAIFIIIFWRWCDDQYHYVLLTYIQKYFRLTIAYISFLAVQITFMHQFRGRRSLFLTVCIKFTTFRIANHRFLSWARWIQFTSSHSLFEIHIYVIQSTLTSPRMLAQVVTYLTSIHAVPGSILGQGINHSDWDLSWFLTAPTSISGPVHWNRSRWLPSTTFPCLHSFYSLTLYSLNYRKHR
jgi:hypothetical protein